LIQRDELTSLPTHIYSKFPRDIANRSESWDIQDMLMTDYVAVVLVLEPMLATGGSAGKAIDLIIEAGVPEENIVFVNVLASQKGLDILTERFPKLRIATAAVDPGLTASK